MIQGFIIAKKIDKEMFTLWHTVEMVDDEIEVGPVIMPVYGVIFCDHFDRLIAYWTFKITILSV